MRETMKVMAAETSLMRYENGHISQYDEIEPYFTSVV
jgi:hypothetical protein